jgi:hypothetical protein
MHQAPIMSANRRHDLLERLFHELFQTETSAARHPRVQARKLGDTPPAHALEAVARHAEQVRRQLPVLARAAGLSTSLTGRLIGSVFHWLRHALFDRVVDAERSYRATLLGLRHGLDLVRLLREVADREGLDLLVEWCDDWAIARTPMVEAAACELYWFAEEPESALEHAGGHAYRAAAARAMHH